MRPNIPAVREKPVKRASVESPAANRAAADRKVLEPMQRKVKWRRLQVCLKHLLDKALAAAGLILLSPAVALIMLAIKLDTRGPMFFVQERIGKDGRRFRIIKFRTMIDNAIQHGKGIFIEPGDSRITRVGRILRRFSLDEIPQFINVLKGEMSLIGPRPTLEYQVQQYDDFQRRRLAFKPGITGLAQVHGRNDLSWPERIVMDIWYIENWSLLLDLKILLKTVAVVFSKRGLYTADLDKFKIR